MKKFYFILAVSFLMVSCTKTDTKLSFRHFVYESFVTDSVVLELGNLIKESADKGDPIYYTAYDIEFPVEAISDEVLRRLQLNVINALRPDVNLNADDARSEMDRIFSGMKLTENDSCPVDPIGLPENRQNITSFDINAIRTITNSDSLYTLCITSDYYAVGAAHGLYSIKYLSFSTITGNELTFDSLFMAGADTVFCNFMKNQIPIDYKESYNCEFTFHSDPVVANGSFYFSPDGIIFSFPPYAIGSFADGQIDCLIPVSISKPLLRKNWSHLMK
ncbi:MAG: RsiV family protein [Paludibacteraceae bacterium]|nr:RsiV family protein [Paludibacteraceae bacterium]